MTHNKYLYYYKESVGTFCYHRKNAIQFAYYHYVTRRMWYCYFHENAGPALSRECRESRSSRVTLIRDWRKAAKTWGTISQASTVLKLLLEVCQIIILKIHQNQMPQHLSLYHSKEQLHISNNKHNQSKYININQTTFTRDLESSGLKKERETEKIRFELIERLH